jgi:hypothetical protein
MLVRPDAIDRRSVPNGAAPRRGTVRSDAGDRVADAELARRVDAVLDVLRRTGRRPRSAGRRAGSGQAKP